MEDFVDYLQENEIQPMSLELFYKVLHQIIAKHEGKSCYPDFEAIFNCDQSEWFDRAIKCRHQRKLISVADANRYKQSLLEARDLEEKIESGIVKLD